MKLFRRRGPDAPAVSAPERRVQLVDEHGAPAGTATVAEAHAAPGTLHRAFSVVYFDPPGNVLVQRRAAAKDRFGGLWSNTCCSHPSPEEDLVEAAHRRLREELNLSVKKFTEAGSFVYVAYDPGGVWAEFEHDTVLVCAGPPEQDLDLRPDPAEIDALAWLRPAELFAAMEEQPQAYTPWFRRALELAVEVRQHR